MSAAAATESVLPLRALAARAESYSLADQMTECMGLLQTPEILVESMVASVNQVRSEPLMRGRMEITSSEGKEKGGFFYPSRELFVQGDFGSFTCLSTGLGFVGADGAEPATIVKHTDAAASPEAEASTFGRSALIDFAAVTCEARPFPLLGFTPATEQESAYPALLRGLAGMIDLTRPRYFELLDREVYRGLLGPAPVFDLALVLWDDDVESDPRRPLCELTRDLAELLKNALADHPRFPPVLNNIVCLRMNPKRFDARLRFVWRV
ncbi:MAG: hypothetical protein AB8G23_15420 [Myxococcota bacterium]